MNRLFAPLAAGFKLGLALRRAAYRQGWFRTRRLNRPVVSIGNLTMGGTGKTPLVRVVAEILLNRGWNPSILTRGYGRGGGADIVAVPPSPGRTVDAREVGDEPAQLAEALEKVPIVICSDRYRAGRLAEDLYNVDIHLLDDGFQHWALTRDVDVVALDVTQEFSDQALLPAGRLREPCSALERADLVVLTRMELGLPGSLEERVRRINTRAPVFHASTKLHGLVDIIEGRVYPAGAFAGEVVSAFCGIGNPRAFFADLKTWGFRVAEEAAFRDHHLYKPKDLHVLANSAKRRGAVAMVTTEKDAMNLPPHLKPKLPIVACVIQTEIHETAALEQALFAHLEDVRVEY